MYNGFNGLIAPNTILCALKKRVTFTVKTKAHKTDGYDRLFPDPGD